MSTPTVASLAVTRFQYLLASLLMLILVQPFLRGTPGRMTLVLVFSGILVSAVWGLQAHRPTFIAGLTLAVVALASNWIGIFVESLPLQLASRAVTVALLGLVVWTLLADIGRQTRIEPATIYQAACVYMMLGVVFAFFYASIGDMDPGAFNPVPQPGAPAALPAAGLAKWVYFSFVTLTTVGYGDITPVAPAARSLVILEALLGQFFVAVLVARLVGLLQTQMSDK